MHRSSDEEGKSSESSSNSNQQSSRSNSSQRHYTHKRGYVNRSRSNRSKINRPGLDGPLVPFKKFMEQQQNKIKIEDIQKEYNKYKNEHQKKQAEIFFEMNKDQPWFKEKYDPQQSYMWKLEQIKQCQMLAEQFSEKFLMQLDENCFYLSLDEKEDVDYEELIKKENSELSSFPLYGFDANLMTLYLKAIPNHVNRWDILNRVRNTEGFVSLSMSEPLKTQNFLRYAWVSYNSEENCQKAIQALEKVSIHNFHLTPVKSVANRKSIRITPPLCQEYVDRDLELVQKLIREVLDPEKQIEGFNQILEQKSSLLTNIQLLDLHLLYLRKVHAYCFYCGEEYEDERMLASKCGPQHLRNHKKIYIKDLENNIQYDSSKIFQDQYTKKCQQRIQKGSQIMMNPEEDQHLRELKLQYVEKKITEVQKEQKYQCNICQKLFKGPEFVSKHIFNKHSQDLENKFNKVRFQELIWENYFNDPNKFINQPTDQQNQQQTTNYQKDNKRHYHNNNDRRSRRDQYESEHHHKSERRYIDYDDPVYNKNKQNNERQLISYDDLF